MKIGIGLPNSIPDVSPSRFVEWAAKADAGPFSSLSTGEGLLSENCDSLILLAGAAAVTKRIRLMTIVMAAPLRNAGVLAKQAASIDVLSGGRLSLGLSVGMREADFRAAPADFRTRGRRFDEMLETMKKIWSGEPLAEDIPKFGLLPVQPGGPELLIGGQVPVGIARVGKWGDGYAVGAYDPEKVLAQYRMAQESWTAHGRDGKPRLVGHMRYALGPDPKEHAAPYLKRNTWGNPASQARFQAPRFSPEAVREAIQVFEDIGMDEILFEPCIADLDQIDMLAEATAAA